MGIYNFEKLAINSRYLVNMKNGHKSIVWLLMGEWKQLSRECLGRGK